ncbi:hypothetical protein F4808DRAFT_152462 [Astrocystis sublimbata]|nr:hypothetical protein F4808DRAFT_152462 [Astrocystis sublimbata]
MPHRVVDFFRSPNDSLHSIKQTVQRRTSPTTSRRNSHERQRPTRASSYASSTEGEAHAEQEHQIPLFRTMDTAKDLSRPKEHHRLSFPGLHLGGHKTQKEPAHNPSACMVWKIESSPAIFYGSPEESTGALVSGRLQLNVKESLEVESLEARFEMCVTQKKPFSSHCQGCETKRTVLKSWSFLREPTVLAHREDISSPHESAGTHEFPLSILLEGQLPATTDNSLFSIRYELTAEAWPQDGGLPIKLRETIPVRRSLPEPQLPHHSVRIFPPTKITANVHYDAVVHPNTQPTFTMRLEGIGKHNKTAASVEYWKLKRVSWKLEEVVTTVAPACKKHAPKITGAAADAGENQQKKGTTRTDMRVIAHADLQSGWKTDYYSEQSSIEAEIEYNTAPSSPSSRPTSCDMRGSDGTEITHRLVVEMVVAQEYAPLAHTRHVTPTGVARILRMNFGVVVTDHGGLGVSWDNEQPPLYQYVDESPPSYARTVKAKNGSVEELNLDDEDETGDLPPSPSYFAGERSPAYCGSPFTPEELGSSSQTRMIA